MSAYYPRSSLFGKRAMVIFVAIIAFHLVIIYAFATGLASDARHLINTILQTNIIETQKVQELPPPPPHVDLKVPPPVQVVAPEVTINIPVPAPITVAPKRAPPPVVVIHVPPAPVIAGKVTYMPDPQDFYPDASRRNNEEGRALVHICVDVRGRVASAEVSASTGHQMLDEAAVKLAKGARFKPATQKGKPVEWCTGLPVKFVLTNG